MQNAALSFLLASLATPGTFVRPRTRRLRGWPVSSRTSNNLDFRTRCGQFLPLVPACVLRIGIADRLYAGRQPLLEGLRDEVPVGCEEGREGRLDLLEHRRVGGGVGDGDGEEVGRGVLLGLARQRNLACLSARVQLRRQGMQRTFFPSLLPSKMMPFSTAHIQYVKAAFSKP